MGTAVALGGGLFLGLAANIAGMLQLHPLPQSLMSTEALRVAAANGATYQTIGFVGLIVPHILRPHVDSRPSRLLLSSGLASAALLLAADTLLRLVAPWVEVRIGVLTALLGAPFFLWLVLRLRAEITP